MVSEQETLKEKVEQIMMNSLPQNLTPDYFKLKNWLMPEQEPKRPDVRTNSNKIEVFVPDSRSREGSEDSKRGQNNASGDKISGVKRLSSGKVEGVGQSSLRLIDLDAAAQNLNSTIQPPRNNPERKTSNQHVLVAEGGSRGEALYTKLIRLTQD